MKFLARAPSNIALIKYMGKTDFDKNLPTNPSLSMTLQNLCSFVEVEKQTAKKTHPMILMEAPVLGTLTGSYDLISPKFSDKQTERMQNHIEFLCDEIPALLKKAGMKCPDVNPGTLIFRSANTFPHQAGVASSASSFAAYTLAVLMAHFDSPSSFSSFWKEKRQSIVVQLAALSRQGSGSSCRSFEGPWVEWNKDKAMALEGSKLSPLSDLVLMVNRDPKPISSSEAHHRVTTSPLWDGRVKRVKKRLDQMKKAIMSGDLKALAHLSWEESWEMHSLFHTSSPNFTYWKPASLSLLNFLKDEVDSEEPPVVTMDAGPNVHVLVPEAREADWAERISRAFPNIEILIDRQGRGAEPVL